MTDSVFTLNFLEPMECLLVSKLPEGPEWTYEIKLDGYRAQALCDGDATRLLSRNAKDLGLRFPEIASKLGAAVPNGSILDGGIGGARRFGEAKLQPHPKFCHERRKVRLLCLRSSTA
jgi:ATP-dependent DNA ligase